MPMSVAITGASGLVGRALAAHLESQGHRVIRLVRRQPTAGQRRWQPQVVDAAPFEDCDAVVHLAGESIAGERWSPERQAILRQSRVDVTTTLVASLRSVAKPPGALVSASAVGVYGDRGDTLLDETAPQGSGYLARLAGDWENAALAAASTGTRVVLARFGLVLATAGGALAKMLPPFRLGLGGRLGAGTQWMSWIALDDCVAALVHLLRTTTTGPVNVVAPEPVTNATFTETLGAALRRPTVFAVPAFALRLALGGLADEGLLASQRAVPSRLQASGFGFRFPTLPAALRHILGAHA